MAELAMGEPPSAFVHPTVPVRDQRDEGTRSASDRRVHPAGPSFRYRSVVAHPLVEQLRFTRREVDRALRGTPEADAERRIAPMNSIGWIVGHLAWQEQRYWLTRAQGRTAAPILDELVATGGPATTPPLRQMRAARRTVMAAADPWLDALTTSELLAELPPPGPRRSVGDALQRAIYHQWFHIGEILAIRQILGHGRLPEFVGDVESLATYRRDPA